MEFLKGTRVWWRTKSGLVKRGICVTDEDEGYVFVAVDAPIDEPRPVVHAWKEWLCREEKNPYV